MKIFCTSCGGITSQCPYCGDCPCLCWCHEGNPDAYHEQCGMEECGCLQDMEGGSEHG